MAKSELEILVEAKVKDAVSDLKKVDKSIDNMKKSTTGSASAMKSMHKSATATFAKLAGGVGTVLALTAAYKQTTEAFFAQEEAERSLQSAISRNPYMSGAAQSRLEAFASELQSVTTIGDEAAIQMMSVAVSMGRTEDQTMKMVKAAADASSALGISMESALRGLNKSFSGLSGELGELVPEMNDLTQSQKEAGAAVDLIAEKFSGASEALADTASGGVKQLTNAWGDYKEMTGQVIAEGMAPFNKWLTNVLSNATKTRNRLREVAEALSDPDSVSANEQTLELLREQRDIIEANLAARHEAVGANQGNLDITNGLINADERRLESLSRIIRQKEIEAEYNRKAEEGNELLAEQQERRAAQVAEFSAAEERIAQIREDQQDPLQREIDSLQERIDKLAAIRASMRETGRWDQSYQDTINALVVERKRLEEELIAKRSEGNDEGEEEVENAITLNSFQREKLDLEEKIATARMAMESSSGAERDYFAAQLSDAREQYNVLMQTEDQLSSYEQGVAKITAAWEKAQGAAQTFGGVISGLQGVYSSWMSLQQNQFDQYRAQMQEEIEIAREKKEEQLEIINEQYDEELTALEEQLESDAITREEYLQRKAEIDKKKAQQEKKAAAEEAKLQKELRKEEIKLAKQKFKMEKAQSTANALINGAEAFTKALTAGPIMGPILASAIAGLTAAQVAMIQQQEFVPPPALAEGGVATRRTLAEIGEGGEPEAIVPLSKAAEMGFGGGGGQIVINVNGPVYGIRDLNEQIYSGIQKLQKQRKLPSWKYTQ